MSELEGWESLTSKVQSDAVLDAPNHTARSAEAVRARVEAQRKASATGAAKVRARNALSRASFLAHPTHIRLSCGMQGMVGSQSAAKKQGKHKAKTVEGGGSAQPPRPMAKLSARKRKPSRTALAAAEAAAADDDASGGEKGSETIVLDSEDNSYVESDTAEVAPAKGGKKRIAASKRTAATPPDADLEEADEGSVAPTEGAAGAPGPQARTGAKRHRTS
jgi:hypothetical protein